MTPPLSRALSYASECLPSAARRTEFINNLRPDYPANTATLDQFIACDNGSVASQVCLRRISFPSVTGAGSARLSSPDISSEGGRICRLLAQGGETAIANSSSTARFAVTVNDVLLDASYRDSLDSGDRALMEGILRLYASHLNSSLEEVRRRLRTHPDWAVRLSRYGTPVPVSLNPEPCVNAAELERRELTVPGLAYSVAVFRPANSVYPWEFVQSDLRALFEIFKVFLTPPEMELILRPAGLPNLSILLSGPFPSSFLREEFLTHNPNLYTEPAISRCGLHTDHAGGEYQPSHTRIWIRSNPGGMGPPLIGMEDVALPSGVLPVDLVGNGAFNHYTWEAVIHEFAHAIYYQILNPRPAGRDYWTENDTWRNIERFYRWVRSEFRAHPGREEIVPNYSLGGVGVGDTVVGGISAREYALTNATEFFAELVTEFIKWEIDDERPASAYYRARRRILLDFFSASGLNAHAFDPANIEAAFRNEGIAMTLPSLDPSPAATPAPPGRSGPTFLWRTDFEMTRPGRYGPATYLGIATHPLNSGAPFLSLGIFGHLPIFNTGFGGELAVEGAIGTPNLRAGNSAFRFEFYARAGAVLDNPAPMIGAGGRLAFTPYALNGAGFHLFAGGGFSTTFQASDLPFGFSVGLGINPF